MKKSLRHVLLAVSVILAGSCSKESLDMETVIVAENVKAVEAEFLNMVNNYRTSAGYSPLAYSEVAYSYANQHNDYMIATGTLSHDNFSARASGITSKENAKSVAENVAKDYPSASQALEGLLSMESHRKTLEGEFSHTAVSVKKDAEGNLYYTQLFYLQ